METSKHCPHSTRRPGTSPCSMQKPEQIPQLLQRSPQLDTTTGEWKNHTDRQKAARLPSAGMYPHPVGRHRAGLASVRVLLCPGWQLSCRDAQAMRKSRGNVICHYKSRRAKIGCRADRRQRLCCSFPPWHVINPLCHLNTYLQEEQQRDRESTCLCNKTKMLS